MLTITSALRKCTNAHAPYTSLLAVAYSMHHSGVHTCCVAVAPVSHACYSALQQAQPRARASRIGATAAVCCSSSSCMLSVLAAAACSSVLPSLATISAKSSLTADSSTSSSAELGRPAASSTAVAALPYSATKCSTVPLAWLTALTAAPRSSRSSALSASPFRQQPMRRVTPSTARSSVCMPGALSSSATVATCPSLLAENSAL
eukprot:8289-Heterococcus_DN1.PRE.3